MKKTTIIISSLIILAGVIFYSCSKEESNLKGSANNNKPSNLKSATENPFEYVGIEHNLFLQEYTTLLEASFLNNEWTNIEFQSDEYRTKFSSIMNDAYHNRYLYSTSTVDFQVEMYNTINLNEWYDRDQITSLDMAENVLTNNASNKDKLFTMNLLNDLFSAIENANNDDEAFKALKNVIASHEQLILAENWTPDEDYALGALAVAKHSTMFWENYDFSKFQKTKKPSGKSAAIVGADVAGYVVGGVVGATSGSFAGPAGSVGGFLGGKAIGAWAGSAAASTAISIYEGWCDFFSK